MRRATLVLALVGAGIAGYLTWVHYGDLKIVCFAGGGGCEKVQSSSYAELAGIPVAVLGLAGYLLILASLALPEDDGAVAAACLSLAGFGFSLYLTWAELFRIDAICQWCAASACVMTVLAAVSVARVLRVDGRVRRLGAAVVPAVIVVVAAIVVSPHQASPDAAPSAQKAVGGETAQAEFGGIPQHGATLGDPNAPHTVLEYSDLICPACRAYSEQILPSVVEVYVRTGKLRLQLEPFAFLQPWSQLAAQYSWAAAEQDRMFQFVKVWYANQGDENTDYVNDTFARKIAAAVPGLDADRLIRDSRSAAVKAKAVAAARRFGAHGLDATPAFLGGRTGGTLVTVDLGGTPGSAKAAIGRLIAG